jgi:hypothetical protein
MKCSKPRFAPRLRLENLESRLQPGSMITGQSYGWSLLADNRSILDLGSVDNQSLVSQASSESKSTFTSAPVNVAGDHLDIAVVPVIIAKSEASRIPTSTLVDNLASGLTNEDLSSPGLTDHLSSAPLATVALAAIGQVPPPATPAGGVPQSPTGVAAPASPVQSAGSTPQLAIAPAPAAVKLNGQLMAGPTLQSGPTFHVTTQSVSSKGADSRSAANWATYVGSSGEDRLLGITLDPNSSNSQPIVVVGFTQNPNDPTDYEGLVARISTDGSAGTVFTMDLGSNSRTEFHSAAVDPNDGAIYVTGLITQNGTTTDVLARVSHLSTVDWDMSNHPNVSAEGNSLQLDSTGTNLYVTGDVDGNAYLSQLTDLSHATPTVVFNQAIPLMDINNNNAPSTGKGVTIDSSGNIDVAVQIQSTPDAEPGVLQISPGGASMNWGYTFPSTGPNGSMNGVAVDASDNVYVTGGVGVSNPPLLDELVASFDSSGNQLAGIRIVIQDNQGNPSGQIIGHNLQVDNSANGTFGNNVFTAVTDSGTDLLGNIDFLVFDPGLTSIVQDEMGTAFGSNDDQNRGLVLDPTNSALYQAGFTNSPDFMPIKSNAFQPTYGGDPYDGVLIGYEVA